MNKLLSLSGTGFQIATSQEAEALRKKLLGSAAQILVVKDDTQVALARFARDNIHTTLKEVEEMRVEIKRPILEAGRKVDECSKTFCDPLLKEKVRIESLMGGYARELEAKRRAAEAEAEALRRKQQQELEDAEAKRQQALQDLEDAKNKAQRKAAMAEIAKTEVQVTAAAQSTEKLETLATIAQSTGPKGVKDDVDYLVEDVRLLYKHEPFLCDVAPRRQEILRRLRLQQKDGEAVGFPGLKIVSVTKVR